MEIEQAYRLVKASNNFDSLLPAKEVDVDAALVRSLRPIAEMILVRVYDDWYLGDVKSNLSIAIHAHAKRLNDKANRPMSSVRPTRCGSIEALEPAALFA